MKKCFFITRLDEKESEKLKKVISILNNALISNDYDKINYASRDYTSISITDIIMNLISTSNLVIADISSNSPNVFYELGFAHALGKKVLMIMEKNEDGENPKIPFDISNLNVCFYSYKTEDFANDSERISKWIKELDMSPVYPYSSIIDREERFKRQRDEITSDLMTDVMGKALNTFKTSISSGDTKEFEELMTNMYKMGKIIENISKEIKDDENK